MRQIRSFLPLLCLTLLYWGCQKSDTANHPPALLATKPTTTTINVPEHVAIQTVTTDSIITSFASLANLLKVGTSKETDGVNTPAVLNLAVYDGYTKTYDCTSNTWTYVFAWEFPLPNTAGTPSGTGTLTVGTFSTSGPMTIVGTESQTLPNGLTDTKYFVHCTMAVPNDDNYCNSTTLQEMISFSYTVPNLTGRGPNPITTFSTGSNTESADPNVYQTYNDIVAGLGANGNGTFTLDVVPGVTVCGSACHISADGFPPTVTFFYSLEGSGTWQSFSQAGTDLNEFFIPLPQAGTYDYYTQEDTAPGVLSGQLGSGSVIVQ
jgi:hypothetical protein